MVTNMVKYKEYKDELNYFQKFADTRSLELSKARYEAATSLLKSDLLDKNGNLYSTGLIDYEKLKDPAIQESFSKELYSKLTEYSKKFLDIDTSENPELDTKEISGFKKAVQELKDDILVRGLYNLDRNQIREIAQRNPEYLGQSFQALENNTRDPLGKKTDLFTPSQEISSAITEKTKDIINWNSLSPVQRQNAINKLMTDGIKGLDSIPEIGYAINRDKLEDKMFGLDL